MFNKIVVSVIIFITQVEYDSVHTYRIATLMEDFCSVHEKELEKIEKTCHSVLETEVENVMASCTMQVRNQRAPYKKIDGKYRQFCICDNEIRTQLFGCEDLEFNKTKLIVSYDVDKNHSEFVECIYTELLVLKRMEEIKKKKAAGSKPKPTKKKKTG